MSKLVAAVSMRQLLYFITVAEKRSFRRAAEALHMSQPPLTQQIQALERVLDIELFDRTRRQIELTAAGTELLDDARKIIAMSNRGFEHARAVGRGLAGKVRIGLTDDLIFAPAFGRALRFGRENPEVGIESYVGTSADLLGKLTQNSVDLILTNRPIGAHDGILREHALPASRIMAVVPEQHRLARRQSLAPGDLENEALVHMPAGSTLPFAQACERLFADAQMTPCIEHQTHDASVALRFVMDGYGVAVVSEFSFDGKQPALRAIPFRGRVQLEHALLHHARKLPPTLDRAIDAILGQDRGAPASTITNCAG